MAHDLLTLAFQRPAIDWHGIAPELVLLSMGALITLVDILFLEKARPYTAGLAGLGLLATAGLVKRFPSIGRLPSLAPRRVVLPEIVGAV